MSLAINRKMKFTELMKLTGAGKGSLSNHIEQMESDGLIRKTKVSFFTSPRVYVEITEKGLIIYERLLETVILITQRNNVKGVPSKDAFAETDSEEGN